MPGHTSRARERIRDKGKEVEMLCMAHARARAHTHTHTHSHMCNGRSMHAKLYALYIPPYDVPADVLQGADVHAFSFF